MPDKTASARPALNSTPAVTVPCAALLGGDGTGPKSGPVLSIGRSSASSSMAVTVVGGRARSSTSAPSEGGTGVAARGG